MSKAKSGDKVSVHYTGKHTSGEVFDSSAGREPLEFELGSGMVIKGFDDGITGMEIGEKKTIVIPAKEAYGEHIPENVVSMPRSNVPENIEVAVGTMLNMHNEGGQVIQVQVTELSDESITLDANHPLAGKDLTFDLELVAIN